MSRQTTGQSPGQSSSGYRPTNPSSTASSNPTYSSACSSTQECTDDLYSLATDIGKSLERYCSRRPTVVAGLIFAAGFVVGWKLRPW